MLSDKENSLKQARSLAEAGKNEEARICILELL